MISNERLRATCLRERIHDFLKNESGAMSTELVVLMGGLAVSGVVAVNSFSGGAENLANDRKETLSGYRGIASSATNTSAINDDGGGETDGDGDGSAGDSDGSASSGGTGGSDGASGTGGASGESGQSDQDNSNDQTMNLLNGFDYLTGGHGADIRLA